MKEFATNEIKNIGLLGHASTGKTSLAEAILFSAGNINRLGRIDDGNTVSDYHEDEISRKFSISSSLLHCEWKNNKINLVDTPGYLDFISEANGVVRVVDLSIIIVHGQVGVEVGTEQVFNLAEADKLPCWFVVNMLDKEHADFDSTIESIKSAFGRKVIRLQIPTNQGVDFDSIVDIISMKKYISSKDGKVVEEEEIPEDLKSQAEKLHEELIEIVAESDDALLEKFFDEGTLSKDDLQIGLKKAILSRAIFPVFAVSAYNNIAIRRLMDNIISYAPSPADRESFTGSYGGNNIERKIKDDEPTSLFVFKTISESHIGELSLFRIMSGTIGIGVDLLNVTSRQTERISQVYLLNGKEKKEIAHLYAGDMGAVVKLKKTHTGDTLSDPKSPIVYPRIEFPEPVIQIAVGPKSRGDEEKISTGLQTLSNEDPTFTIHYDPELKQLILSGQGELHMTIILERLKQKYNVQVNQMPPRIPYRETITSRGESKFRHKKQSGGAGQFAEVWMYIEPLEHGAGVEFKNTLAGQSVDRAFVPSVEKGVKSACEEGILAGYKVVDIKAVFYDGKQHPVDSKDIAFQIAGKGAFRECFINAKPILLEPIHDLEVIVPDEFMGDVMSDLSVRRGKIQGMDSEGSFQKITAKVPLAELYRYSTSLRSMTQGKGLHHQKFSHYEPIPHEFANKVVEESKKSKEEK